MHHYVYKIIDTKTKEFYIGSRSCKCNIEDDTYMGSPIHWKPSINNLIKQIIKCNFRKRKTAFEYEAKLILECSDDPLNRNYHVPSIGFCFRGAHHSKRTKEKLSKSQTGKKHSEETKQKISKSNSGQNHPMFGKYHSKETKEKIRMSLVNRHLTKKHRQKISQSLKGRIPWNKGLTKETSVHIKNSARAPKNNI